jgi:ubiquinone biosynthesis protein COQ9
VNAAVDADDAGLRELRDRIVDAILPHVAFEGWTDRALRAAAVDLELSPAQVAIAFPEGRQEIIRHWSEANDRRLLEHLQPDEPTGLRGRERIAQAVQVRIALDAPRKEAVRRTIGYLALPTHQTLAARCLSSTIDTIWYACGDSATNFSYYTKRATLAGVYMTTLLYWLEDESEDGRETWAFLERRIHDAMRLPRLGAGVRAVLMPFLPRYWRPSGQTPGI